MAQENKTPREDAPPFVEKFLKEPPMLLRNFHHDDILEFLDMGQLQQFVQDDVIINKADYVNSAYLIADGDVSVWKDNIQLNNLSQGEFLGETFLFSKNNRIAKIIAEGETKMLKFKRYDTLNFFRKKPEKLFNIFTRNIIEIQQNKVNSMNVKLCKLKKRLLNDTEW